MIDLNLAKVGVEGSNPFARTSFHRKINDLENHFPAGGADFAVFGSCWDFSGPISAACGVKRFKSCDSFASWRKIEVPLTAAFSKTNFSATPLREWRSVWVIRKRPKWRALPVVLALPHWWGLQGHCGSDRPPDNSRNAAYHSPAGRRRIA